MAKNMFENFDFDEYAQLLAQAKEDGVSTIHTFNTDYHKGGFTVAWVRDDDYQGKQEKNKVILAAVSYCSPEDYFCRKIGNLNALRNLYGGNFVALPIGSADSAKIVQTLRMMFSYGL